VIEGEAITRRIAEGILRICIELGLPLVFKASFDKANRTSGGSFRGSGMARGLSILSAIRRDLEIPVTTDVHLPEQAAIVAEHVDLLQIPAFLCRQTDLLEACGATGKPVNIKKGQFLSPWDMGNALDKALNAGASGVLQTERGSSFGYQNLVVDMGGLAIMAENGWPVVFDGTHSVQHAPMGGTTSRGQRELIPPLVRAAVAAGVDALFLEVHENPAQALSDAATQFPLSQLGALLEQAKALHELRRRFSEIDLREG
jgi:2-dehydro-3-deoxyphosphooctonate aldolase (KDO 8-P synthase)